MARTKISPKPSSGRRWELAASGVVLHPRKHTGKHTGKHTMAARRSAPGAGVVRRRAKPGVKALREIVKAQKSVDLVIPHAPLKRLFKEIAQENKVDIHLTELGYIALHHALEEFGTDLIEEANRAAVHAGRLTITVKDINFARRTLARGAVRWG